jgi:hypothetical protein
VENCGLDLCGKMQGLFAVSCEHGHKTTGSMKVRKILSIRADIGRAIAQAVSRWLPTAAVRGSSPGLLMWDFVVDKVALG